MRYIFYFIFIPNIVCFGQVASYFGNIPLESQENSQWCWAACIKMIRYHHGDTNVRQCEIASQVIGNINCCSDTATKCKVISSLDEIRKALSANTILTRNSDSIKNILINKRRPIVLNIKNRTKNGTSHVVVGIGIESISEDNNKNDFILVNDPINNIGKRIFALRLGKKTRLLTYNKLIEDCIATPINNVVINNVVKIPEPMKLSLTADGKNKTCNSGNYSCKLLSHLKTNILATVDEDVFFEMNQGDSIVTQFEKVGNKWEPMLVYKLKPIYFYTLNDTIKQKIELHSNELADICFVKSSKTLFINGERIYYRIVINSINDLEAYEFVFNNKKKYFLKSSSLEQPEFAKVYTKRGLVRYLKNMQNN
jgi:hypothetical protein